MHNYYTIFKVMKKSKKLKMKIIWVLMLVLWASGCEKKGNMPKDSPATITFINVQKADAIIIQADGKNYLIDTGTKESFNQLKSVLDMLEIKQLDGVFLTHGDKDHIGGFSDLSKQIVIKQLYISEFGEIYDKNVLATAKDCQIVVSKLTYNQEVTLSENCAFKVLSPSRQYNNDNNNSLVMLFTINNHTVLFTGDMCEKATAEFMENNKGVEAELLKVAHHGDSDCNSQEFIDMVDPRFAVISTEYGEKGTTDHLEVIKRLGNRQVFMTEDYQYGISFILTKSQEISWKEVTEKEKH